MASLSMDMPGGHEANRNTGRGLNCIGVVGGEIEGLVRAVSQHGCHHFSWGAIRLPQENIQLCLEFNKLDATAGPSPSCKLASEDLQDCSESPLSLWILGIARAHPPHSFWVTMELIC